MARVRRPIFVVDYEGKNITAEISQYLISLSYNDKAHGESDEIDIQLENSDGRWIGDWLPETGDRITVQIGYEGLLVNCGTFTIDEISASGPPDVINLRGLAVPITKALRTKKSSAFESQSLRQIAEAVAAANSLTLVDGTLRTEKVNINFDEEKVMLQESAALIREAVRRNSNEFFATVLRPGYAKLRAAANRIGDKGRRKDELYIETNLRVAGQIAFRAGIQDWNAARTFALKFATELDRIASELVNQNYTRTTSALDGIRIERTTQNRETDLAFLKRIGEAYGFLFSVRDDKLIFIHYWDVEKAEPSQILSLNNLISYSFKKKADETYKSAKVKHHNPKTKELVEYSVNAGDDPDSVGFEQSTKEDTLEIRAKSESRQQAEMRAKAALHKKNSKQQEGDFNMIGDPLMVAGNNFAIDGLGQLSGIYNIIESKHSIDRSGGYTTSCGVKKIDPLAASAAAGQGGPVNFCQEKSCLKEQAAKLRSAASKNTRQAFVDIANSVYQKLSLCGQSLINKGDYKNGNYILTNVRVNKGIIQSGFDVLTPNMKIIATRFAAELDKIAGNLKC